MGILARISGWSFDAFRANTQRDCTTPPRREACTGSLAAPDTSTKSSAKCAYTVMPQYPKLVRALSGADDTSMQSPPREMRLAPTDMTMLVRHSTVPWALFYQTTLDPERLQHALAQVLRSYTALSGRLVPIGDCDLKTDAKADAKVILNNEGALFTMLESTATVDDFGARETGDVVFQTETSNKLPPYVQEIKMEKVFTGKAPLLYVRLTMLAGGGCILGITIPHIIGDGFSMENFVFSLSTAYNTNGDNIGSPPENDRRGFLENAPEGMLPFPPDPRFDKVGMGGVIWKVATGMWRMQFGDVRRQVLTLSADKVKLLKEGLSEGLSGSGDYITSNDALVTFAWLVLRAVRDRTNTKNTKHAPRIVQAVNMRNRMPRMTNDFFGNGAWISVADADKTASPGEMALSVRKGVEPWSKPGFVEDWAGRLRALETTDSNTLIRMAVWPFFSDGMITSWQFTNNVWDVNFDGCTPYWFYGGIFPQVSNFVMMYPASSKCNENATGTSANSASNSSSSYKDCGVKICFSVTAKKMSAVTKEAKRLLDEICGPGASNGLVSEHTRI